MYKKAQGSARTSAREHGAPAQKDSVLQQQRQPRQQPHKNPSQLASASDGPGDRTVAVEVGEDHAGAFADALDYDPEVDSGEGGLYGDGWVS